MSGFEVAGLILGIFPLLIEGYDRILEPYKAYRKFSSKFKAFHDGFEVQRIIFCTECILLLAPLTTRTLAIAMLNDTQHPSWSDERLNARFDAQLGFLGSACKAIIQRIGEKLRDIEQRSKEFENIAFSLKPQDLSGKEWRKAIGKKLKFGFRSDDNLRTSLDELIKLNDTFRILSCQVVRLETELPFTRDPSKPGTNVTTNPNRFQVIRNASIHLYESLCKACDSDHEHFARFSLDINQGTSVNGYECVRFRLSYMIPPLSTTVSAVTAIQSQSQDPCGQQNVSAQWQYETREDQMKGAWLDIQSVRQVSAGPSATPAGRSTSNQASHLLGGNPASKGFAAQKSVVLGTGARLCSQLQNSSLDPQHSISGSMQSSPIALSSTGLFQHFLHCPRKELHLKSYDTISAAIPLSRFLSQLNRQYRNNSLPEYQRLSLARVLSGAALQLRGTPWLSESFVSDNIQIVDLGRENMFKWSWNGNKAHSPFVDVPLKLDKVEDDRVPRVLSPATTSARLQGTNRLPSVVPNEFLYHLGIVLLELAYQTPFESLVAEVRHDDAVHLPLSADNQTAEFQIACRLADNVGSSMGADYARIAKKCIRCDFGCGETLEDVALQTRVLRGCILHTRGLGGWFPKVADFFGHHSKIIPIVTSPASPAGAYEQQGC